MERRLRHNGVLLLFSLIVCMSIWQIKTGPKPSMSLESELPFKAFNKNFTYTHPMNMLNASDYSQLMDLRNFSFTMMNKSCNETYPFLIILVHTAPRNFAKRKTIRETWGQRMDDVKLLFMLGAVDDRKLQMDLELENTTHGDIVQGTFTDAYRNVTYKHAMVFKYVIYHCPYAKFLLKTDDDVFVNLVILMDFLKETLPNGASDLLLCGVHEKTFALRSSRSKWRVSFDEYAERYYPPYCSGYTLLYSANVVFKLYMELQDKLTKYFWIDDVLITGIIFKKLNLVHTQIPYIVTLNTNEQNAILANRSEKISGPFFFAGIEFTDYDVRRLWSWCRKYVKGTNQYYVNNNNQKNMLTTNQPVT